MFALGIGEVGVKTAKDLAKKYCNLDNLRNASFEEILEVDDVGEVIAQNIVDFFADEYNKEEIQRLFDCGVEIKETNVNLDNQILSGKTFVLTGTLSKPREEFEKIIEDLGGKTSSSVSRNTSFVLAGENAGSKLLKAKELNIKIINEKEFLEMIK